MSIRQLRGRSRLWSSLLAALAVSIVAATLGSDPEVLADKQSSGGWTTTAEAASGVVAGGNIDVTVKVTAEANRNALVAVEIHNPTGQKVHEQAWDNQSFTADRRRSFTTRWNVPANTGAGRYTVKIGIFRPGGGDLRHWNNAADTIAVTASTPQATTTTVGATTTTAGATTTTAPHHQGQIPANQLPRGNPIFADSRVLLTNGPVAGPTGNNSGNFRQSCEFSHMSYDDPIVHPGNPGAAHLHTFFGNTGVNHASTHASLTAAGSKSTCAGGAANLSAYWTPVLMNGATPIAPSEVGVYYKSHGLPASSLADIPRGLKMVAGNMNSLTGQAHYIVHWACVGAPYASNQTIPSCPAGSLLEMAIAFPQCWDGVSLDSADHISHLRYADWNRGCSVHPGHPVPLPQLSIITRFRVPAGGSANLRLSSDRPGAMPGASGHADYMEGWNRPLLARWSQSCMREARDTSNSLCDGGNLVIPNQFQWYP